MLGTVALGIASLTGCRDCQRLRIQASKILAAGRHCDTDQSVEEAFAYALSRIKRTDAVIVGFWPKFKDELAQDVHFLCKYGSVSAT